MIRPQLVIFDCDGVLIDSEGPAARLTAQEITALGWPMTTEESLHRFVGYTLLDMVPVIEAHRGRKLPPDWVPALRHKMIRMLSEESTLIPGAEAALRGVAALGLPFRVASNSAHEEMGVKFARTGLVPLVQGRIHSARDVARGKPAPDVFLAAAAAEGVPPEACVVIEDSLPGTTGAVAAGMQVLGFDPHGDGAALAALGATVFHDMRLVPSLIQARLAA